MSKLKSENLQQRDTNIIKEKRFFEFLEKISLDKPLFSNRETQLIADIMLLTINPLHSAFTNHLRSIQALFPKKKVTCFISYAWASKDAEYWTQEVIYCIFHWLKAAGIKTVIDKKNSRFGKRMQPFMFNNISEDDFIILMGTKTLRDKLDDTSFHNIQLEYKHIEKRIKADKKNSIIPIIIDGENNSFHKQSLPDGLFGHVAIEDFSGNGLLPNQINNFVKNFRGLIAKLYGVDLNNNSNPITIQYKLLWRSFKKNFIYCRGNRKGNLTTNPLLYLQQVQQRQKNFGKKNWFLSYHLPQDSKEIYVGNEDEINEIKGFLKQDPQPTKTKVIVVSGIGGAGKTAFARQINYRLTDVKSKAWIDVEPHIQENLYQPLTTQLGFDVKGVSYKDQQASLFKFLEERPGWLITLDDVNYLQIKNHLPPHGGYVLITSRLDAQPRKDIFHFCELKKLSKELALKLFTKHLQRVFDEKAAPELLKELGYLPLAIVQAARYINVSKISINSYLNNFNDEPFEATKLPGVDPQHKNVWKTLGISIKAITTKSKELKKYIALISLFSRTAIPRAVLSQFFNLQSTERDGILTPFLTYYLLSSDPKNETVWMHPLVSTLSFHMVEDKITPIKASLNFIKHHFEKMTELAKNHFDVLVALLMETMRKISSHQLGNDKLVYAAKLLLSTAKELIKKDNMTLAPQLVTPFVFLLQVVKLKDETQLYNELINEYVRLCIKNRDGFELLNEILEKLNLKEFSPAQQIDILLNKGRVSLELDKPKVAISFFEEALAYKTISIKQKAQAYANCLTSYAEFGDKKVIDLFPKAMSAAQQLPNGKKDRMQAYIKANLAEFYVENGELDKALKLRFENLEQKQKAKDSEGKYRGLSWDYFSIARIFAIQGNMPLFEQYLTDSIKAMNKVYKSFENWPLRYKNTFETIPNFVAKVKKTLENSLSDADYKNIHDIVISLLNKPNSESLHKLTKS